jgi:hypothetical protein
VTLRFITAESADLAPIVDNAPASSEVRHMP